MLPEAYGQLNRDRVRFGMILAVCALLLYCLASPAYAHNEEKVRYANAAAGVDEGDCTDPQRPCRTSEYVRTQAGKGDELCLAAGLYRVNYTSSAMIRMKLFNPLVRVNGACATTGHQAAAAGGERPVIVGLPKTYSAQLTQLGLTWGAADPQLSSEHTSPDSPSSAPAAQAANNDSPSGLRVAQATSTRRYVDSNTGVDRADCANPEQPCKTIQYARSQAMPLHPCSMTNGHNFAPETRLRARRTIRVKS
jgi:hypothetical protein